MMLKDFEFADSPVRECLTDTRERTITILFEDGYYLPLEKYVGQVRFTIHDWDDLGVYTSFSTEPRIKVEVDEQPVFDAVKLITSTNESLILQGYPVSGGWLVYEFLNPKTVISILGNTPQR